MYVSRCLRFHPVRIIRYCIFIVVAIVVLAGVWQYFNSSSQRSAAFHDEFPSVDLHREDDNDDSLAGDDDVMQRGVAAAVEALPLDAVAQAVIDYIAAKLNVRYNVLSNDGGRFHVDIQLTNTGDEAIAACCWAIYFVHMKFIDTFAFNSGMPVPMRGEDANGLLSYDVHFELSHINGYTFQLKPNNKFRGLAVGALVKLRITGGGWAVSRSEVIPNWYVTGEEGRAEGRTEPRVILSTAGERLEFVSKFDTTLKATRGEGDLYRPFSPEQRFRRNKVPATMIAAAEVENRLLPTPIVVQYQLPKQFIRINSQTWKIVYTPELLNEARYIRDVLGIRSLEEVDKSRVNKCVENSLTLGLTTEELLNTQTKRVHVDEAYHLSVQSNPDCVVVCAHQPVGVFYALVSFISLAHGLSALKGSATESTSYEVDVVDVKDGPRYSYRGLMVDSARNFQPVDRILKLLDVMALYKLNKLHFHLSDDEGWRLEIPGLPELTEFGSRRGHDVHEEKTLMSMLGSGPFANSSSGSGFYRVTDYQRIVRHAAARHVEVVPEFDMPSHSHAAIKSMQYRHTRLTQHRSNSSKSQRYLLSDVDDRSIYLTGQFFRDSAINPCIESAYRFVELVMTQVINMHSEIMPLKRWHFGGDEVPQDAYSGSPACQEFLRLNPQMSATKDLKTYFVKRLVAMAGRHGLSVHGWEDAFTTVYGLPIDRSKLKNEHGVVSQAYYNTWEGGGANKAYLYANLGYEVIVSPITALYFDNPQEPDPEDWGLHWATRYVDTKRTFNLIPDSLYDSIDEEFWGRPTSKNELCALHRIQCTPLQRPENILGLEAALWSELVRTSGQFESQLWPRLLALAERSWHKAAWEETAVLAGRSDATSKLQREDWARFATSLGHKELRRIERLAVDYYLPRPGARTRNGKLYVNTMFPGLVVQLSSDGGKTWLDYHRNTEYSGSVLLATRSFDGRRRSVPINVTVS